MLCVEAHNFRAKFDAIIQKLSGQHSEFLRQCEHFIQEANAETKLQVISKDVSDDDMLTPMTVSPDIPRFSIPAMRVTSPRINASDAKGTFSREMMSESEKCQETKLHSTINAQYDVRNDVPTSRDGRLPLQAPQHVSRNSIDQVVKAYTLQIDGLKRLTAELPHLFGLAGWSDELDRHHAADVLPGPKEDFISLSQKKIDFDFAHDEHQAALVLLQEHGDVSKTPFPLMQQQTLQPVQEIDDFYTRNLDIKEVWRRQQSGHATALMHGSSQNQCEMTSRRIPPQEDFTYSEKVRGPWKFLVGSPRSQFRVIWEMFGILLVLYDLIVIPMSSTFQPPESDVIKTLDWITTIFWTLNVLVALTTGYIQEGVLMLKPSKIMKTYFRTWFIVDALTLPPAWFFAVADGSMDDDGAVYMKLLRALRLLRLGRLARMLKIKNVWQMVLDMIKTEKVGIFLEVFKMVLMLMLVNHYIACMWFYTGKQSSGKSWLKEYKFTSDDADWFMQYVVSYHWSITQFTPSSMQVQPQSLGERIFAIVTIIFALVGFSYLVGSITGSLAKLRSISEKKTERFWLLRRFLIQNNVPNLLAFRIKAYAESAWDQQQGHARAENVEVLSLLSDHLREELAYALHGPSLCIHPLFEQMQKESPVTIRRLAFRGINHTCLAPADMMFYAGEAAEFLTIVTDGVLEYHRIAKGRQFSEIVEAGEDWIAEPVLWVDGWLHLGDLEAQTSTDLLHVIPELFHKICDFNPIAYKLAKNYAMGYARLLNSWDEANLSDITQGEDVSEQLWTIIAAFTTPTKDLEELFPSVPSTRTPIAKVWTSPLSWLTNAVSLSSWEGRPDERKKKNWKKADIVAPEKLSKNKKELPPDQQRSTREKRTDGALTRAYHSFQHTQVAKAACAVSTKIAHWR